MLSLAYVNAHQEAAMLAWFSVTPIGTGNPSVAREVARATGMFLVHRSAQTSSDDTHGSISSQGENRTSDGKHR
jgi:hypothetical protein